MSREIQDPEVLKLLENMTEADGSVESSDEHGNRAAALSLKLDRLNNKAEKALQPGMLAQWKAGLKNRLWPEYGEPVIVMEILDTPVSDLEFGSGSPYFREPLSLLLGRIFPDGVFTVHHYDMRRFEPYRPLALVRSLQS